MNARWWIALGVAAATFGLLDACWLGVVAAPLYRDQLGHLMAAQPDLLAALLFYAIFLVGLLHFVIRPDLPRTLGDRLRDGALFGLVSYATWDLTSKAVFRDFPWTIVAVDLAWGVLASVVVTAVAHAVLGRLRQE